MRDSLLSEIRRALEFDRAHVVVVADAETLAALPRWLADGVRDEIVIVPFPLHDIGEDAVAELPERVAAAIGTAEPTFPGDTLAGAPHRTRVALVVPDALAIDPEALRTLHRIAEGTGMRQRLILLADAAEGSDDPARELASRLGEGVSKIDPEGARPPRPSERSEDPVDEAVELPAPSPQPPRLAKPRRRSRPIAVRRGSRRGRSRAGIAWLTGAALLAGCALLVPDVLPQGFLRPADADGVGSGSAGFRTWNHPTRSGQPPHAGRVPPLLRPMRPGAGSAPLVLRTRGPLVGPVDEADLPPVGLPHPGALPAAPRARPVRTEPVATGTPTAPAPTAKPEPRRITVSLNAQPWADLEIDGRPVGATPIATLRLREGEHRVVATFPDGRVVERTIEVDSLRSRFRID